MAEQQVMVRVVGSTVTLAAPYDPALPAEARKIGGKFEPAPLKLWRFDARDETRVRELAISIYGTDGSEPEGETVTVRVPLTKRSHVNYRDGANEYRIAGRRLCWRPSRDEAVRFAEGVVVAYGEFERIGGSMRYPDLGDTSEVVLEVRDLPLSVAQKMQAEQPDVYFVVDGMAALERRSLEGERERLVTRLAEIDAELARLDV